MDKAVALLYGAVSVFKKPKTPPPNQRSDTSTFAALDRSAGIIPTRRKAKRDDGGPGTSSELHQNGAGTDRFQRRIRSHSNTLHAATARPDPETDLHNAESEIVGLKQQISSLKQRLRYAEEDSERSAGERDQAQRQLAERDKAVRNLTATLDEEKRKAATMQEASIKHEDRLSKELRQIEQRVSTAESLARAREGEAQGARRALEGERQKAAQWQNESVAREEALTQELLDTRKQLATTASDLALIRTVAGDDGDAQGLVTMFEEINDDIDEFAFRLARKIRTACGDSTAVSLSQLQAFQGADAQLYTFLQHFLEDSRKKSHAVQDVLAPMAEAVVQWLLSFIIFNSFMPLQTFEDQRMSSELLNMQQWVQSTEPQQHSARWRAVTYKAVTKDRDDAALAPKIVQWIVDYLRAAFCSFLDRAIVDQGIKELEGNLTKIVFKALRWQDQSRTRHYTYDYLPFLPLEHPPFLDAEMEAEEEASTPGTPVVLLPLSMGLRASRAETAASGLIRVHKILKKARVLVA